MGRGTSHTQKDAETLLDIAKFWYSTELARTRVYPQDISTSITLTPDGAANTFGAWTEIIPAGTVPFPFVVHTIQTEGVGGADAFFIQLAINAAPAGNQYLGEKRFNLGAAGRARVTLDCPTIPANTPVYGRVKTGAGANTLDVSVSVTRCLCTPELLILLANKRNTWPW